MRARDKDKYNDIPFLILDVQVIRYWDNTIQW